MKKLFVLLLLAVSLLTACNANETDTVNSNDDGISLEEFKKIVNLVNSRSDSDLISELSKTAMGLLAYGRDYTYNSISEDTIQIIAVKADDLQEEFNCYYDYSGGGIKIVWEFGIKNLYVKTVDEDGSSLFEFHFHPDGKSYLINPEYQDEIIVG